MMVTELDIARSNLEHADTTIARLTRENAALLQRAEEAEDRFAIGKRDIAESSELARTLAKENAALKSERDEGLAREALHRQAILDAAKTITALRRAAGDGCGDALLANGREMLAMDEALNRIAEAASEWPNALAEEFGSPVEFAEAVAGKIARLRTALACETAESTARMQGVERELAALKAAAPMWVSVDERTPETRGIYYALLKIRPHEPPFKSRQSLAYCESRAFFVTAAEPVTHWLDNCPPLPEEETP